mmetsp:Transcript_42152/g.123371  ORF Transcript_42152/g.123371 Transcript_42152/m.123371 type:complete len:148 (+) Transcript_42152:342-785(+)
MLVSAVSSAAVTPRRERCACTQHGLSYTMPWLGSPPWSPVPSLLPPLTPGADPWRSGVPTGVPAGAAATAAPSPSEALVLAGTPFPGRRHANAVDEHGGVCGREHVRALRQRVAELDGRSDVSLGHLFGCSRQLCGRRQHQQHGEAF